MRVSLRSPGAIAAAGLVVLASVLVGGATPAGASTFTPTNWRSEVVSVTPDDGGATVEVVGGDAAMQVAVEPGHSVTVLGYQEEPYLRVTDDGSAEVNVRSPAYWLNRSRFGSGPVPDSASADAEPDWQPENGTRVLVWHDHRMHAMAGSASLRDWRIDLIVDDQPVVVEGTLDRLPSPSPLPAAVVAVMVAVAVLFVGRRRAGLTAAISGVGAGAIALTIAGGQWLATPAALGREVGPLLVAAAAIVIGVVAVVTSGRVRLVATLASLALAAGWTAIELSVVTGAIVPGRVPETAARLGVGAVIGLILSGAGLAVTSAGVLPAASTERLAR